MRARYSAYALAKLDFLQDSIHPKSRSNHDPDQTREWATNSDWLGLEIVSKEAGGESDDEGLVEFIARYKHTEDEVEHHEHAQFRKHEGRWFFWDGRMVGIDPFTREAPKVGRNDPCPCGSGKKHKKCCGKA